MSSASPASNGRTARRSLVVAGALVAAIAAASIVDIFRHAWWDSHDHAAYIERVVETLAVWSWRNPLPRWAPDFYGGYGAPFFSFYSPGVHFAAAIVSILTTAAPPLALKLIVLAAALAGGIGALLLCWGETRRVDAAFVGAVLFVCTPYRTIQLFTRGDLAEYVAISLVPAMLFAYRELARARTARRARAMGAVAIACHAGTILTHTLTGQWATILGAGFVAASLVRAWRTGDRAAVYRTVAVGTVACAVTGVFTIPALLEKRYVHLEKMTLDGKRTLMNLVDGLDLIRPSVFFVGFGLLACIVAHVVLLARRETRQQARRVLPLWLFVLALIVVLLKPAAFLWPALPFWTFMGFPWRLLGFVAVFSAVAATWTFAIALPSSQPSKRARVVAGVLAALLVAAVAFQWKAKEVWEASNLPRDAAAMRFERVSTTVFDEYLPRWVERIPLALGTAPSASARPPTRINATYRFSDGFRFRAKTPTTGRIDINSFYFPGWMARDVVRGRLPVEANPSGLLSVLLPEAGEYDIRVSLEMTPAQRAGLALTVLALLGAIVVVRRLGRSLRP